MRKWLRSNTIQGIAIAAATAVLEYLQTVPGLSAPMALGVQMVALAWATYGRKKASGPL